MIDEWKDVLIKLLSFNLYYFFNCKVWGIWFIWNKLKVLLMKLYKLFFWYFNYWIEEFFNIWLYRIS